MSLLIYCVIAAIAILQPSRLEAETSQDEDSQFPTEFWLNEEKSDPLFVAEAELEQPLLGSNSSLRILRSRIRMKQQPELYKYHYAGQVIPECEGRPSSSRQGSAPEPQRLDDFIFDSPSAFVGAVRQLTPGWNAWANEVAVLAHVEVEEIVHGSANYPSPPSVGQVIGVLFSGGSIQVEGVVVCDNYDESFYRPGIDERVLITGVLSEADPGFFLKSEAFPVMGDLVMPQPYAGLCADASGESLTKLRGRSEK